MNTIYLDHAATTPADPEVIRAMTPYFGELFGNPSSLHSVGREAKKAIEEARETIASFLGVEAEEIIFTGGGTESNNLALKGTALARMDKGNHIITSSIEHHSVFESCRYLERNGFMVTYAPVDEYGFVDLEHIEKSITERTILISIMHANNEIGTIQPIAEIGRIAKERDICFHTDGVQTFGHLPLALNEWNVDMLSASAHKFYGPKGVGILYVRRGTRIQSFMHGGEQERGLRPSTHNVPGIVGMAKAVEVVKKSMAEEMERQRALRDKLIEGILKSVDRCRLNGHPVLRLPGNVNISFAYVEGESLMLRLDREGVVCSTGSACSSAGGDSSHVLKALGLPREFAYGAIRFSLGRSTSENDINHVLQVLPEAVKELRAASPSYKEKASSDRVA